MAVRLRHLRLSPVAIAAIALCVAAVGGAAAWAAGAGAFVRAVIAIGLPPGAVVWTLAAVGVAALLGVIAWAALFVAFGPRTAPRDFAAPVPLRADMPHDASDNIVSAPARSATLEETLEVLRNLATTHAMPEEAAVSVRKAS